MVETQQIIYVVSGGFALGIWGITRTTMARLSEQEKQELFDNALAEARRRGDFKTLHINVHLEPDEYIEFLDWAYPYIAEKHEDRPAITGVFLL